MDARRAATMGCFVGVLALGTGACGSDDGGGGGDGDAASGGGNSITVGASLGQNAKRSPSSITRGALTAVIFPNVVFSCVVSGLFRLA